MRQSCGRAITIRREEGQQFDTMLVQPANGSARVIYKGEGLYQGTYTIATDGEIMSDSKSCKIYGQSGSGSAALVSSTITRYSGTPYTVATFSIVM